MLKDRILTAFKVLKNIYHVQNISDYCYSSPVDKHSLEVYRKLCSFAILNFWSFLERLKWPAIYF